MLGHFFIEPSYLERHWIRQLVYDVFDIFVKKTPVPMDLATLTTM
jgi:hypothetical protein